MIMKMIVIMIWDPPEVEERKSAPESGDYHVM